MSRTVSLRKACVIVRVILTFLIHGKNRSAIVTGFSMMGHLFHCIKRIGGCAGLALPIMVYSRGMVLQSGCMDLIMF
jgi:hypothetical protein